MACRHGGAAAHPYPAGVQPGAAADHLYLQVQPTDEYLGTGGLRSGNRKESQRMGLRDEDRQEGGGQPPVGE